MDRRVGSAAPIIPCLRASLVLLACVAHLACGPGGVDTTTGTDPSTADPTTDPATTGSTTVDATTVGPTTDDSSDSTQSTTATDPGPLCGDGDVDRGEGCDDGNDVNGDGCNNDCVESASQLWEFRSDEGGAFYSVAVAEDGTIFAGGSKDLGRWFARFSADGALEADAFYPSAGSLEIILDLAVTPEAVYAVGDVTAELDFRDLWLAQLDYDGAIVWEDVHDSGFGPDWGNRVALTDDGGIIVAGRASVEDATVGTITRRFDLDGALEWSEETAPGVGQDTFSLGPGLALAGGDVVVGTSLAVDDGYPGYLVTYSAQGGAPLSTQEYTEDVFIMGLAADPSGDLLSIGSVAQSFVVHRRTSDGQPVWTSDACLGSTGRDIVIDSQGDIVVVGYGEGQNNTNVRLCKLTPEGALRWGLDIDGGVGDDLAYSLAIAEGDVILVAGGLRGDGQTDAWLAAYAP
ncbi:MAG: hypothetical protein R3A51_20750 [Nannocystaceae bacterium]